MFAVFAMFAANTSPRSRRLPVVGCKAAVARPWLRCRLRGRVSPPVRVFHRPRVHRLIGPSAAFWSRLTHSPPVYPSLSVSVALGADRVALVVNPIKSGLPIVAGRAAADRAAGRRGCPGDKKKACGRNEGGFLPSARALRLLRTNTV